MDRESKEKFLKIALRAFGAIFLLIYPLGMVWPAGWVWHGGEGFYYLQMIAGIYAVLGLYLIAAARNPSANRSLISFTIWSSGDHGRPGPRRSARARTSDRRRAGPAPGRRRVVVPLAQERDRITDKTVDGERMSPSTSPPDPPPDSDGPAAFLEKPDRTSPA